MKRTIALSLLIFFSSLVFAQQVTWVYSSDKEHWKTGDQLRLTPTTTNVDVNIDLNNPQQTIEGFGTCFNELGWTSLNFLSTKDRESIMKELFAPGVGANFTIGRMPVGANDFSRQWYSYDETEGDFAMKHFNINNDLHTLIPFIKDAQKYNPSLRIWASPWSPPTWMKYNHHYAARSVLGNGNYKSDEYGIDMTGINNGLSKDKEGTEGTDMFIQEDKYYKAYALYFSKFIQAYRKENIRIAMVMPQNEFNSTQVFPSCTWTAKGLSNFISYLGPQMKALGVRVFFGTMERPNSKLVDTVLKDQRTGKYIKGVGFQWGGKEAIPIIHKEHPNLSLYQTEQECGNGKNDWKYCVYAWGLMKHYLGNGANAYMYWNTSLKEGGISTWGWKQNSLVSVDTVRHTYKYNYEYYLMKHLSHFVKPGAKRLSTSESFNDLLAFRNPDNTIAIVLFNESNVERTFHIRVGNKMISPGVKPLTFNTFLLKL